MARRAIGDLIFGKVYPLYLAKVERKGRTRAELEAVIEWLTGYDADAINRHAASETSFQAFFEAAPRLNPDRDLITGMICGHRVEQIQDPIARQVRQLDKLVDELAKGRPLAKIMRRPPA